MASGFTLERIYLPSIDQSNAINAARSPDIKRNDMANFYEDCLIADNLAWQRNKARMEDGESATEVRVDFKAVNDAVLDRWSMAGLTYIKKRAWKQFEAKCSDGHNRSEYA